MKVIVVGGGIVGTSVGYHLAEQGVGVTIFDRQEKGAATHAGAGIISPQTDGSRSDTWTDFAVRATHYYPDLVERLRDRGVKNTSYSKCGLLKVAVTEEEESDFSRELETITNRQSREGYPDEEDLFEVTPEEARDKFPLLGSLERALYFRNACRINGHKFTKSLFEAAADSGLVLEEKNVDKLVTEEGAVRGVIAEEEERDADAVVIAGGAWSVEFEKQLQMDIPVKPQRGQILHLSVKNQKTDDWPIVTAMTDFYLVPWGNQKIVAGATRESDSGFQSGATEEGIRRILGETMRMAPKLGSARVEEVRVGLRPLKEDLLPLIGPVPRVENVFLCTGHGPAGLQLGPYSGKLLTDLVLGNKPDTDPEPFLPVNSI